MNLIGLAAFASILAPAAAELPLLRGFYIDNRTPCSDASNVSLYLLTRTSLQTSNSVCTFQSVTKVATEGWHTEEACTDSPSGLHEWVIPSETEFSRFGPGYELHMKYCPQDSLPLPWRNNDIRDLIR